MTGMDKKPYGVIYSLESPSGKFYIGQTTRNPQYYIQNVYEYYKGKDRPKIRDAIKKYGFNNFIVTILASSWSKDGLDRAEICLIKQYNSIDNGYNLRTGGGHGKHRPESIEKCRVTKLGKKCSEEHCKNIGLSKLGTVRSESTREKARNSMMGKNKGRVYSDDMKKNMRKNLYTIKMPDGEIIPTDAINPFCEEYSLSHGNLLSSGRTKGFTLLSKVKK
jgi:group I intron endonuclease